MLMLYTPLNLKLPQPSHTDAPPIQLQLFSVMFLKSHNIFFFMIAELLEHFICLSDFPLPGLTTAGFI